MLNITIGEIYHLFSRFDRLSCWGHRLPFNVESPVPWASWIHMGGSNHSIPITRSAHCREYAHDSQSSKVGAWPEAPFRETMQGRTIHAIVHWVSLQI